MIRKMTNKKAEQLEKAAAARGITVSQMLEQDTQILLEEFNRVRSLSMGSLKRNDAKRTVRKGNSRFT